MYKKIGFKKSMRTMLAVVGLSLLLTAGLGATVSAAPPMQPAAEMHDETGVLILSVVPDSPADEAGIVRGDIVLAVDGEAIDSVESFAETIGALSAGDEIVITVLHGDDTLDLATTLGERAGRTFLGVVPYAEEDLSAEEADVDETDTDGATEEETDEAADENASNESSDEAADEADKDEADEPTERRSLRSMMPFGQGGAMIADVLAGGPADEAGLVAGDLIVAVDGEELSDDVDFAQLIGSYAPGDVVTLTVTNIESNETLEVPVTLGAHPEDEERAFLGIAYALAPTFPGIGDVAPDEGIDDDDADLNEDEAIEESDEGGEDAAPAGRESMMPVGQGGAMIADVLAGGPADEAGLVAGDLIVAVDGEELSDDVDFAALIGAYAPGDEVTLTVTNAESNEKMEIPVVLGAHPEDEERAFLGIAYVLAPAMPGMGDLVPDEDVDNEDADSSDDADMSEDDDGDLQGEDADEDAAPQSRYYRFAMPSGPNGAKISEVVSGSPAADAGLAAGDLIVAVNGEELSADANLGDLIGAYAPGDEVELTIQHRGSDESVEVTVTLGAHPDNAERAYLGVAYMPTLKRHWHPHNRHYRMPPMPHQGEEPKGEDGDGCFHGHEGCEGDHGYHEHGDMMPFFHHGFENFDLDQLSEEDRDALQEMFPFLFPDVEPESESQGEDGL